MSERQTRPVPLAIVGLACRFPKADGVGQYWSNILNGVDCITEIPPSHWRPEDYFDPDPKAADRTYANRGGFLSPTPFYPLECGIPPTSLEATDTSQLLGMAAAKDALADAGYGAGGKSFDRDRVSVILGVTGALELVIPLGARLGHPIWRRAMKEAGLSDEQTEAIVQKIADGYVPWQEQSFPGLLGNVVAGRIANHLDLGGSNCVVDAACASSLSAIHLASLELTSGRADMALTGGVDTFNDIFMYMCFSKTPALSPSGDARPFDAEGDGTILGEGVGVVALKRLADAERDGDRIYAVIKGMGSSSDGKGNAIYAPSPEGQVKALRRAYELSGVEPGAIGLIEGHGTGTKVGDNVELRALNTVFGETERDKPWCAVGSVKSQIGHAKAAAGAAGLIKAALSLRHNVLPPSIKTGNPLPGARGDSPFFLNANARPWMPNPDHPRRAGVSAFGFGGSNYHCVLEEHQTELESVVWDGRVLIVAFSGADERDLENQLAACEPSAAWTDLEPLAAKSLQSFRAGDEQRLLLVVERDKSDWPAMLKNAAALLEKCSGKTSGSAPEGIYYGAGEKRGRTAVLFPGQGAQYAGMFRDLACRFPQMQRVLADVDQVFAGEEDFGAGRRLTDLIYPPPAYDEDTAAGHERRLRHTQNAQPAIGAVSVGALKVLNHFGFEPESAAGHSYGEITALCASERFDAEALYLLSRLRGKLMAEGEGDRGAMLAVRAPQDQLAELLEAHDLDLALANKNAPDQVVLSGATAEIQRAAALLDARGVSNKKLNVAAAFHSSLVAQASKPFSAELQKVDFPQAKIPVYANATAQPYPESPEEARHLLADQLIKPVEFVQEIRNMHEDGVRVFLEVGPGARLTGLVKSILAGEDFHALAIDASSGKRPGMVDLAKTLAQLAAFGCTVDLTKWEDGADYSAASAAPKKGFAVTLTGANYVDPKTRERAARPIAKKVAPQPAPALSVEAPARPRSSETTPLQPRERVANPAPPRADKPAPPALTTTPLAAGEAMRAVQANLSALQRMQSQTAELHRQFLEGQDRALQQMAALMEQQQGLLIRGGDRAPDSAVATQAEPLPAVAAPRPDEPAHATPSPSQNEAESSPAAATASQTPQTKRHEDAERILLAVVAEKTGYPAEMLSLDMKLDADLGIDSIKRVEILSAFAEQAPELPSIPADEAGALQTLGDVIARMTGDTAAPAQPPAADSAPATRIQAKLLDVVAEKTGYPADMLALDMSLDADLGIDSIKRVEILSALQEALPELPEVQPDQAGEFQTLGDIVNFLGDRQPATVAAQTAAQPLPVDRVQSALLSTVAEKTGYPADMLSLDMSLDADLGIDSIKRVEILSALQEALPELPEVQPDQAGRFQTLGDIVAFLGSAEPAKADAEPVVSSPGAGSFDEGEIAGKLLEITAEKTGYPADMLELDMALESDLGVDSIKRVEILSAVQEAMPSLPELEPDRAGSLTTLRDVAVALGQPATPAAETVPPAAPKASEPEPVADGGVACSAATPVELEGVRELLPLPEAAPVWIAGDRSSWAEAVKDAFRQRGLDATRIDLADAWPAPPDGLAGLTILAPEDQQNEERWLARALMLAKHAGPALRSAGSQTGAFLATASRLDGAFGFGSCEPSRNPLLGGLAGLSKTAKHEWSEVDCKAIDVAPDGDEASLAQRLATEALSRGPLEIGLTHSQTLTLRPEPAAPEAERLPLQPGDTVLVTGGARGVTAETCEAIARAFQPRLVLMGRSAEPAATEPEWLRGVEGEAALKRAIMAHAEAKMTPRALQKEYGRILADREIRHNLARLRDAGAEVVYRRLDLRDADACRSAVRDARAQLGAVKGLIHGAGVLADRLILDKTEEQFEQVYRTKLTGLNAMLAELADDDLRVLAFFSSSTARFGRAGQVDYAMANEALNKLAQQQARTRPECRVVSMNWGPWDGGMVTPDLKKLFASEGVPVIPLRAGAECLVDQLRAQPGAPVEIVVMGETDAGAAAPPAPAVEARVEGAPAAADLRLAFERVIDLERHAFLRAHVLNGRAVLPMAVMVEWLSHAAIHAVPGTRFHGFENLRVLHGVTLENDQSATIGLYTGEAARRGSHYLVPVELRDMGAAGRVHARAEILLGDGPPAATEQPRLTVPTGDYPRDFADVYGRLLFHGPELQGILRVEGYRANAIAVAVKPAPPPKAWMRQPLRGAWLAEPLALDCGFQAVILATFEETGAPSLPTYARAYRQYGRFSGGERRVVAVVRELGRNKAVADIELIDGETGALTARLEGYECVVDASLIEAFRRNRMPATA